MPLRYSKPLRRIFKDILELQRRSALDETLYRNFLHKNRKALRELKRAEDKLEQLKLGRLKTAVQLGLDDSEAGLYRPVPELASPDFMAGGREIPEAEMWAEKRARQAADLAGLQSGALTPDDLNWFAGGIARNAKIKGDLF